METTTTESVKSEEQIKVEAKIIEMIVDKLGVEKKDVIPTAQFTNDLGADSLDTVELIMAFEEEFGMKIPDEEAEKIKTVKDALDAIVKKVINK